MTVLESSSSELFGFCSILASARSVDDEPGWTDLNDCPEKWTQYGIHDFLGRDKASFNWEVSSLSLALSDRVLIVFLIHSSQELLEFAERKLKDEWTNVIVIAARPSNTGETVMIRNPKPEKLYFIEDKK